MLEKRFWGYYIDGRKAHKEEFKLFLQKYDKVAYLKFMGGQTELKGNFKTESIAFIILNIGNAAKNLTISTYSGNSSGITITKDKPLIGLAAPLLGIGCGIMIYGIGQNLVQIIKGKRVMKSAINDYETRRKQALNSQ